MSVRKIPPNRRSITGHIPSKKKPGMLAFESLLERDLYILLEFDPLIRTVQDQPVRISFLGGRNMIEHYTPDCYIEYRDSTLPATLIQVKYRSDLFEGWKNLHPRLRAGARHARRSGLHFRVLTECEIRGPRLENAKWLFGFRSLPIPGAEVELLLASLRSLGGRSTPVLLLDALSINVGRREELLMALWYAVANGLIGIDMQSDISNGSPIWLPAT